MIESDLSCLLRCNNKESLVSNWSIGWWRRYVDRWGFLIIGCDKVFIWWKIEEIRGDRLECVIVLYIWNYWIWNWRVW